MLIEKLNWNFNKKLICPSMKFIYFIVIILIIKLLNAFPLIDENIVGNIITDKLKKVTCIIPDPNYDGLPGSKGNNHEKPKCNN